MWTIKMWTIKTKDGERQVVAGVGALKAFDRACDSGPPGRYRLLHGRTLLATATVKVHEYHVDWRKEWIFYALGEVGRASAVAAAAAFFKQPGQ